VTDVLIVGSGASAVHAAYPLAEAGLRVRMLDFGNRDDFYARLVPPNSFAEIRRSDAAQHRYFLGRNFEGIGFGQTGAGAQLTPPRQYVARDADRLTPIDSTSFFPIQSLGRGGLAGAWGAACPTFSETDLDGMPISRAELDPHYAAVAERIGVSGARDDLLPFFGELEGMLPVPEIDAGAASILRRYRRRRERLNRAGFHLGSPRLAVLTREHRDREALRYLDMEFWSDRGRSVYRPQWTLDELRRFDGFEYTDGLLAERFVESAEGGVELHARDPETGQRQVFPARRLVLAAGTLGTVRIVARSLDLYDRPLPLVCNPHTYAATLHLGMLGRAADDARHSLAQLCFVLAPRDDLRSETVGHLYSYRSLLLFRLVKDAPLPTREGLNILRTLAPALAILVIQHADRPSSTKHCSLTRDPGGGPDRLAIRYELSDTERRAADAAEREIVRHFRRLGCVCLRRQRPGHAASVHYAGTFPMAAGDRELTTDRAGALRGARAVHLVDGSVLPHLPSRGPTFTLMANANRIGCLLRDELQR
jgi:choline dehydrogenase-like flavoprotein